MHAMPQNNQTSGSVSPELDAMTCDVIGAFLDSLAEGEDPGVVVCVEDANGARYEAVFTDDGEEACLSAANDFVAQHAAHGIPNEGVKRIERYAIACTGCVDIDGAYANAVLVSFYERGLESGYSAYVLFDGMGEGDNFMWSDPEPAGEEPALF